MTNRTIPPPFISEPPIYDDFLDKEGKMTDPWINWINSVTRVMGYVIVHDYLIDPAVLPQDRIKEEETPLLQVISLIEKQVLPNKQLGRDELQNARNGTVLYNRTSKRFNFRENDTWVTFTPVAA